MAVVAVLDPDESDVVSCGGGAQATALVKADKVMLGVYKCRLSNSKAGMRWEAAAAVAAVSGSWRADLVVVSIEVPLPCSSSAVVAFDNSGLSCTHPD